MKKKLPPTSAFNIPRAHFENSGFRRVCIAHGTVEFPDGRHCRINVSLSAAFGTEGEITLHAEDINRPTGQGKTLKLRRRA